MGGTNRNNMASTEPKRAITIDVISDPN